MTPTPSLLCVQPLALALALALALPFGSDASFADEVMATHAMLSGDLTAARAAVTCTSTRAPSH
jgi:hypothetical protein